MNQLDKIIYADTQVDITDDEILYWFDILQEPTITRIVEITGYKRYRVVNVLTERFKYDRNDK